MNHLERTYHQARKERLLRLGGGVPVKIKKPPAPIAEAKPEPKADADEVWVEHQKARWFAIVSELDPPRPVYPEISKIVEIVARHFGVSKLDIISARRSQGVAFPRQMAMYLSRKLTPRSLPEIGRRMGHRDHTTILHGCRKIERLAAIDSEVAADVAALETKIGGE